MISASLNSVFEMVEFKDALDIFLKTGLVLLIALLIGLFRSRTSASLRHFILSLAVITVLLLPIIYFLAPLQNLITLPDSIPLTRINLPLPEFAAHTVSATDIQNTAAGPSSPTEVSKFDWKYYIGLAWFIGTIAIIIKILFGFCCARYFKNQATLVMDNHIQSLFNQCRNELEIKSRIQLYMGAKIPVPFASGLLRPAVYLPTQFFNWSKEKQRIILTHELIHLKRLDVLSTLLSQAALVLYWVNPLFWLVRRRLYIDREQAADDSVLEAGISADTYARSLIEVAYQLRRNRTPIVSMVAMACNSRLEKRLRSIMEKSRLRPRLKALKIGLAITIAFVFLVVLGAITTFADPSQSEKISRDEYIEMLSTINLFYDFVNYEYDFESVKSSFLTPDFFDDPWLTMENLPKGESRAYFDNTIRALTTGIYRSLDPQFIVADYGKEGDIYYLRLHGAITAASMGSDSRVDTLVRPSDITIKFARQNDTLLVSSIEGPLQIKCMDVNSPYGPIFLTTIDDWGDVTPHGPMLFKHFKFVHGNVLIMTRGIQAALARELARNDPDLLPAVGPDSGGQSGNKSNQKIPEPPSGEYDKSKIINET
ncbi:MAG: M56 family metallopeptidase [candidate division Zixibacteria bacterium]